MIDGSSMTTSETLSMIKIPLPLEELVGLTIQRFLSFPFVDELAILCAFF